MVVVIVGVVGKVQSCGVEVGSGTEDGVQSTSTISKAGRLKIRKGRCYSISMMLAIRCGRRGGEW